MQIRIKMRQYFLDRPNIIAAVGRAILPALSKGAGRVRITAQRSMRRRKHGRASPPGTPPFAHNGDMRDYLFYGYDPATKTMLVGPEKRRRGRAPELNEFGGTAPVTRFGVTRTGHWPARPFMAPALAKNIDHIPEAFRGSVKA